AEEPVPPGAAGMRMALLAALGGFATGGAAAAQGLADEPLVLGLAEEFGGAVLGDLVLGVHGVVLVGVGFGLRFLRCLHLRLRGGSATSGEFRIFGGPGGLRRARGASGAP